MTTGPLLVVDDEPNNLAVMRQILEGHYPLVFARNGQEALAAVAKHHPALVLLDIKMPDMDGYTVCKALQANPLWADIPVIFVTALSEVGNEALGFEAGAVDYIAKPVSPVLVRARVRTHISLVKAAQLNQSYHDAVSMLGEAGHFNDTDTGEHIWRMAEYAARLAQEAGWNAEQCQLIKLAAPMHDTGKLGIPDSLLRKPGKLDANEWAIMKTHPRIGHDILCKSHAPVFQMAADIALHHHERWDGSGYPEGLVGTAIPESARIVAVADVFDALSMKRPYKEPWPIDRVMATIRESAGTQFEPRLVNLFENAMPDILDIQAHWAANGNQAYQPAP
jgi:putative two-component system response regulator